MNENEEVIRITIEDVAAANQLSLNCPICAGSVEKYVEQQEMAPVFCTTCETLYHLACWRQNGGSCAVLGCEGTEYKLYNTYELEPALTIQAGDIPREAPRPVISPNGEARRLKRDQKRMHDEIQRRSFWGNLWHSLLRAIRIWPSDPSS